MGVKIRALKLEDSKWETEMWKMVKTDKISIFVVVSESEQEGYLFYLYCKPKGWLQPLCSGFLYLFIHSTVATMC